MLDILTAIWVAAAGLSFAVLPVAAMGASSETWNTWVASVWDAWRFPYGAALLICTAGASIRTYRKLLAARRRGNDQI